MIHDLLLHSQTGRIVGERQSRRQETSYSHYQADWTFLLGDLQVIYRLPSLNSTDARRRRCMPVSSRHRFLYSFSVYGGFQANNKDHLHGLLVIMRRIHTLITYCFPRETAKVRVYWCQFKYSTSSLLVNPRVTMTIPKFEQRSIVWPPEDELCGRKVSIKTCYLFLWLL